MREPTTPRAWANFLSHAWGPRFPVDVRTIALEYTAQRFSDPITKIARADVDAFEGALISRPNKGCWYLLYNPNITVLGRINFTLGHELGHYLIHREKARDCRCSQRDLLDYGGPNSRKLEQEANVFASYLLMPLDDFRRQTGTGPVTLDDLGVCAERYNVSLTAATLKWLEYTPQRAVLVVARDDFVLWSRASEPAFKSGVFYACGTPLPEISVAKIGPPLGVRGSAKEGFEMAPGVWRPNEPVVEMTIFSDRYDMTISLLLLSKEYDSRIERELELEERIEEQELRDSWTPHF